jgi:hypothetical protein
MDPTEVPPGGRRRFPGAVVWVVLPPVAVGVAIYLAGRSLTPDPTTSLFGDQGTAATDLKARLGSALLCLALIQLLLALWMYRRLPGAGAAPRPVRTTHRVIGLLAFRPPGLLPYGSAPLARRGGLPGARRTPRVAPPGRGTRQKFCERAPTGLAPRDQRFRRGAVRRTLPTGPDLLTWRHHV